MPFDVFEHHKLFLFDELNDTAKEAAIMEYRYDFQDFDFLMYNDWFFNFSEDEWKSVMSEIRMPEDTVQPERILKWDRISSASMMVPSMELKGVSIDGDALEMFYKIIGIHGTVLADDSVSEIKFVSNVFRNSATNIEFELDDYDFTEDKVEQIEKLKRSAKVKFEEHFMLRAARAMRDSYDDMTSDEYVANELIEREIVFYVDGCVGNFKWDTKELIETTKITKIEDLEVM